MGVAPNRPEQRRLDGPLPAVGDEGSRSRSERRPGPDVARVGDVVPVERRVGALAARQRGVVGHSQLRALGLSTHRIKHWAASGRLLPVFRGVYAVGHSALPPLGRETAALLAVGPGAVLRHHSGATLLGLLPRGEPGPVHVSVEGRRPRSRPGIRVHCAPHDLRAIRHDGLPVTGVEQLLLDLAATEPASITEEALDNALRKRLTTRPRLLSFTDANRHRRGAHRLRALVAVPHVTRSRAERELLTLLTRAGLPPDATNVKVAGHEADLLYRDAKLIVEMDSWTHHGDRTAFERDRRRDAVHLAAGYRVLRVTWRQLTREPEALVARVARASAAPG